MGAEASVAGPGLRASLVLGRFAGVAVAVGAFEGLLVGVLIVDYVLRLKSRLPPVFSTRRMPPISMSCDNALHMS